MKKTLLTLLLIIFGSLLFLTPGFAQDLPTITANSHIQDYGWRATNSDENSHIILGTIGESKRIEAFQIEVGYPDLGIIYDAHVQDQGWQGEKNGPETAGTTGMAKQIESVYFRLSGNNANLFDLYYRTHVENYGWLDWAQNGQASGTTNHFFRCEAIEMLIVPKGSPAPGSTGIPFIEATSRPESQFIYQVNKFRRDHGLGLVTGNLYLKRVCDARLMELPVRLSHKRPNGQNYESIVKDVYPNYPAPGGGFIESFVYGSTSFSNPLSAFSCYMAYPHMMDQMLDPAVKYISWSGRVSGTMGYSLILYSGLNDIDFGNY